jgi:RimJ/RimL family protein N-acetyltransferase
MKNNNKFLTLKKRLIDNNITPREINNFKFFWIDKINVDHYLKLRNNSKNRKFFFNDKISKKDHKKFLKNYKKMQRIDFVIYSKKTIVAIINISKKGSVFEIGKIILKKFEGKGLMSKFFISFIEYVKKEFKIKFIYSKTKYNNINNLKFCIRHGFKIIFFNKNYILSKKKI